MVSMVGGEELDRLQPSYAGDVLRFVPNVEFTGGPRRSGETPSIRGFSGAGLVILVDGARQNFGSAHDGRFFVDPSLLREVEVLRGPASALYGSGGTGGVVEFRTVRAADLLHGSRRFGATASAGYQDVNDETRASFTAYAMPAAGLDLLGHVVKRDSGAIALGDGNELTSTDEDIVSGLVKAGYDFGDSHRLEASFRRFGNSAREPNNGQGLGSGGAVEKALLSEDIRLAYHYHDPRNRLVDLDIVAYRTRNEADELRLDDLGAGPAGELLARDVRTSGLCLDNRSRLTWADGGETTLTYGVEYYRDEQDGAADDAERPGVPDAGSAFLGAFLQAEVAVAEPFGVLPGEPLLIPGVRRDDYESSSDLGTDNAERRWSPRIAASYAPLPWMRAFVNAVEAFRAPSMDEIYNTGVHFVIPIAPGIDIVNRFVPNPDSGRRGHERSSTASGWICPTCSPTATRSAQSSPAFTCGAALSSTCP